MKQAISNRDAAADAARNARPLNGNEQRVLEYLAAMDAKIIESGEALRPRLNQIPNGWRQWRLMASTVGKLLEDIYGTLPMKNLRHMANICNYGEVLVRMRPAVRVPDYLLVNENDLRLVINKAMAGECAICVRQGKEIDRCPMRRAMLNIAPPMDESDTDCGYRDVAMQSELGEYV